MDAEFQTLGDEFAADNTAPVNTFSTGNAMSPGTYLPEQDYGELEGCPVNGTWVLTVRDNLSADDGFIFDWSISFSEQLSPGIYEYNNELVSAEWEPNEWINAENEGSIIVEPDDVGQNELSFKVTDSAGCEFEKNVLLTTADTAATLSQDSICDLSYFIDWPSANGVVVLVSSPNSDVVLEPDSAGFLINVPESGAYTFQWADVNCGFSAQAELVFLEENDPACITGVSDLDFQRNFTLMPNPAQNQVTVEYNIESGTTIHFNLFDATGKKVWQNAAYQPEGERTTNIDLTRLTTGAYILSLTSDEFFASKLLIKK
jgi:hypothetical protein